MYLHNKSSGGECGERLPKRNQVWLITTTRVPASTCMNPADATGVERVSLKEALPDQRSSSVGGVGAGARPC